jgi:hypothetical protein
MGTFLHRVQTFSGAHPTSYEMGTRDSFPGIKVAGGGEGGEADHSSPSSVDFKNAWRHTSNPPIHFHDVMIS